MELSRLLLCGNSSQLLLALAPIRADPVRCCARLIACPLGAEAGAVVRQQPVPLTLVEEPLLHCIRAHSRIADA
jgi:hypothetical protein